MVERGPEKAGVGGSTPSLATIFQALTSTSERILIPFHSKTSQQQCGQANVNGTKLRNMVVPLPPLDEQPTLAASRIVSADERLT